MKMNDQQNSIWFKFWKEFSEQRAFHGIQYAINPENHLFDRLLWIILIATATVGGSKSVVHVYQTYTLGLTETTISTINHPIGQVAFPAVTYCDPSRVQFDKLHKMEFYKQMDASSQKDIDDVFSVLAAIKFGSFDAFEILNHSGSYYSKYSHINLNDVLFQTRRTCEDIFVGPCWWRNNFVNCCEVFELQLTAYGYCYSFNSDVSESSKRLSLTYALYDDNNFWIDPYEENRPRRTITAGSWSGLRFTVRTDPVADEIDAERGAMILVGDPGTFSLENSLFVTPGLSAAIEVWGDTVKATERLKAISHEKRHCLFPYEETRMGRGYLRRNCISECYLNYSLIFCNCTPDFMYNIEETEDRPCDLEGMMCLMKFNVAFSNRLTPNSQPLDNRTLSIICDCPDDCNGQKYVASMTTAKDLSQDEQVLVDVHFSNSVCILYSTDLVFSFMEALVSYGNSAGLFLGMSLLSIAELQYFLTIRLFYYCKQYIRSRCTVSDNSIRQSSQEKIVENTGRGLSCY